MTNVHPLIRFLNRIEGHGYGGVADFEVARTDAQYLLVNLEVAREEIGRLRAELKWISEQRWNENADMDDICTRVDRALMK